MDNGKLFALFVLIIAVFGMYLNTRNQLIPVLAAFTAPPAKGSTSHTLSQYVIAIVLILVLMAFLPDNGALILSVVILLEAFLSQTASGHNIIQDITQP